MSSTFPDQSPHTSPADPSHSNRSEKAAVKQELTKAIGGAHEILFSASTIFPFTLFPDTISIDRTKLSIAHRVFFKVAEVTSIRVEDILNVTASVGPFFGSIKITTRFYDKDIEKQYEIHYLTRADALRIKRIMQGYIIALRRKIDCSILPTHELAQLLDQLGQGAPDNS